MAVPAAPAGAPRAAAGAQALRAPARICALAGKPGRAGRKPRAQTRVAGLSPQRRERNESAWAHELLPGNEAARPPALHYDNIGTTALPEPAGLERRRRSPALERLLGPWERLESRYKMVIATSAAFVLCNMVRPALGLQRRAGQRGRKGGGGARACHPPRSFLQGHLASRASRRCLHVRDCQVRVSTRLSPCGALPDVSCPDTRLVRASGLWGDAWPAGRRTR